MMLKMKNKYVSQKVKNQNRNMNFILGVQSSRSTTSRRRSVFETSSTIFSSSLTKTHTTQSMSNIRPSSSLDSNEKLSNSSEIPMQRNNNSSNNMKTIPSQATAAAPGIIAPWVTTISSVPQLVTSAQTRAVLVPTRKEQPIVHHNRKNIGWAISASLPAIRDQTSTSTSSSEIATDSDDDGDDDDLEESASKYFTQPSTPVRNSAFRTERIPIRSVLNAIQGPPSPSGDNRPDTQNKKSTPYVLQSPWVTRFSGSQLTDSPIPGVLASPGQTKNYSVKEMLDLMCPPRTSANDFNLDVENNIVSLENE